MRTFGLHFALDLYIVCQYKVKKRKQFWGGEKVKDSQLRWFGHVQRRDSERIGLMRMKLPGKRESGRPK